MKQLVGLVLVGLLCLASRSFAYDGPVPLVYDQTIDTIRVEMTAQGKIFYGGYSMFTMSVHVPVTAANVGQTVSIQVRKYDPANGDVTFLSCSFVPTAGNVGTTV